MRSYIVLVSFLITPMVVAAQSSPGEGEVIATLLPADVEGFIDTAACEGDTQIVFDWMLGISAPTQSDPVETRIAVSEQAFADDPSCTLVNPSRGGYWEAVLSGTSPFGTYPEQLDTIRGDLSLGCSSQELVTLHICVSATIDNVTYGAKGQMVLDTRPEETNGETPGETPEETVGEAPGDTTEGTSNVARDFWMLYRSGGGRESGGCGAGAAGAFALVVPLVFALRRRRSDRVLPPAGTP